MARLELAPEIASDFERILEHAFQNDSANATSRIEDIVSAIDVLERNPMIGSPAHGDLRELIVGKGATGYVALYRYVAAVDTVFVLAIRSQREAGYERP